MFGRNLTHVWKHVFFQKDSTCLSLWILKVPLATCQKSLSLKTWEKLHHVTLSTTNKMFFEKQPNILKRGLWEIATEVPEEEEQKVTIWIYLHFIMH